MATPAPVAPAVRLEGVVKRFGTGAAATTALDRVSATVAAGQVTGLVGPDGAGKTTLLRLVAGLLTPDAGRIDVLRQDSRDVAAYQRDIGYMPQRFGLYEDLTVAENLRLHADLHDLDAHERQQRIDALIGFTGLSPFFGRLTGALSGGMKQKLGLAIALMARPRLLLLDEPSAGVDPASRRELWRMVKEMAGEGVAVIWSTAYLDEAERCDSFLLLQEGRLLASGAPAAFAERLEGRTFLLALPDSERHRAQRRAAADPAIADATIQGSSLRLVLRADAVPPAPAALGAPDGMLRPVRPRFEDAFVDLLQAPASSAPEETAAAPPPAPASPPASTDGAAIVARDLTCDFGRFRAVDHVGFTVAPGEIFGLLGPNGAGKSTTFRMLCGLLQPTGGSARVAGLDLGRARAAARERIGYMSQRFSLYGTLSVRDNLDFFSGVYGLGGARRANRIAWAIDSFELAPVVDSEAGLLPLGFKQRLALACALLHEPRVLFLDEPTSGVDPLMRRSFWQRIGALADSGVTVLVTSHFMDEAEYCDRLGIIYAGKLIATGRPDELKRRFATAERPEPTLEDTFVALIAAHDAEARVRAA